MSKEIKLSAQSQKELDKAISDFAEEIKTLMKITEMDNIKISLDFGSVTGTGKFLGVKYSMYQHHKLEKCYDMDVQ